MPHRTAAVFLAILAAGCAALAAQPAADPPKPDKAPEPRPKQAEPVPPPAPTVPDDGPREIFPHVRVDAKAKLVEFDGIVPINAHDEQTPVVYLEVVACTPDTKEHEALVMTKALPSHVHAALLLIGLDPGTPGSWQTEGETIVSVPPTGSEVRIELVHEDEDGKQVISPANEWIVNAETGEVFGQGEGAGWVFAGSRVRQRGEREVYDADGAGTLIGLTTFGSETVAWRKVISPEAEVQEPEWIARRERVPAAGTAVRVRIRPAPKPE